VIKTIIGYGVSAIILFFAILFALASAYAPIRIVVSIILFSAVLHTIFRMEKTAHKNNSKSRNPSTNQSS